MEEKVIEQHSLGKSVFLHLFPGLLILLVFITSAPILYQNNIPVLFGILFAIITALVPFQLGVILWASKKQYGKYSLKAALVYTRPMSKWLFVLLVLFLFLWSGVTLLIAGWLDQPIMDSLFNWLPAWFFVIEDFSVYSNAMLVTLIIFMLLLNGLLGPVVEELYFRGYLLPRIEHLKAAAPVLNAVLFSVYHFFSPWQNIGRMIGLMPMCYVVYRMRNIYVGIFVHCMGNIFASLSLLVFLS
jgi:uncharacterized protein